MKKNRMICTLLALCLLVGGLFAPVTAVDAAKNGCSTLEAQVPLGGTRKMLDTAKAVILYELNTDTLVYAYNPDQQINPTGLVKLLTALVALEHGNLDDQVTVRRSTLDSVAIGAVSAGLKSGEVISLRDLLYCVMVASANDAAAVIAEHIGGTQEAFAGMMNAKAKELGCTASNFTNAHGLSSPGMYSTARDLAIITEAALENEAFTEMFCAIDYTVAKTNLSEPRHIITTNYMMSDAYISKYFDTRVTGGKPAAATTTDRSMICTAEVGSSRYLCVVMNAVAEVSEDGNSVTRFGVFEEMDALLDYAFTGFAVRQVLDDSQALYQYAVSGGENDVILRPTADIFTVLPIGFDKDGLSYANMVEAGLLTAPISEGDVLGSLQIRYGGIVVGTCDLVAMHDVAESGTVIQDAPIYEVTHEEENNVDLTELMIWIGVGILGILVVLVILEIIIRAINSARTRRRHRRRARDRRRSRK